MCKLIFPPIVNQVWVVSWMLLCVVSQGMVLGFTPSLLAGLRRPDSSIKTDLNTESWIVACLGISSAVSTPVSTTLMHFYGRRCSFFLSLIPGIVGLILICFATNASHLMIGRIVEGLTVAGAGSIILVSIGEYSSPKHRGAFLNLKATSLCIGSAISHVLGHFYHWRVVAGWILALHILVLLSMATWCESPAWLASRQRYDECKETFKWLRGEDELAKLELEALLEAHKRRIASSPKQSSIFRSASTLLRKFTKRNFLKPLFIIVLCVFLLEVSGRHIFPAYAVQIISEVTGSNSNTFSYTVSIDLITAMSSIVSSVLVKIIKRRTLLFTSGIATLTVLVALCPYLYLTSEKIITVDKPWIPITMVIAYFITANMGYVPVCKSLCGETLPFEHRTVGITIYGILVGICMMLGLKATPYMILYLKIYGTFAVLGLVTGMILLVLYFVVPETKDRTLEEIEDYFNHGRFGHVRSKEEHDKMIS